MKAANEVRTTFEQKGHQLLLLTQMLMIFASPLVSQNPAAHWPGSILLMVVLLTAAYAVSKRGGSFRVALLLGIPALLSQVALFAFDSFWLEDLRSVQLASAEHHAGKGGDIFRRGEEAGMPGDASHAAAGGVVNHAVDEAGRLTRGGGHPPVLVLGW